MPAGFLHDVPEQVSSSRHWSVVPLSIAAHAMAAAAVIVIPLAADDEAPPVSRLFPQYVRVSTAAPPDVPPPRFAREAAARSSAAPISAASAIAPEEPAAPAGAGVSDEQAGVPAGAGIAGGMGLGIGVGVSGPPAPPEPPPAPPKLVRPGGIITAPAKVVHVPPVYPAIARSAHVEGLVILEAVINERGGVEHVKVLRSVPLLDAAAIDAVRSWRYTPTLLNGVPVQVLMTITVNFSLRD